MKKTLAFVSLLLSSGIGRAQNSPGTVQLIGVTVRDMGLAKARTYQYGKAENLDVWSVLPVVARHGTARQQKKARRLTRSLNVQTAMLGAGLGSTLLTGFLGPSLLQTRQISFIGGSALFLSSIITSPILDGQARRLVRDYNNTLLNDNSGYYGSYAHQPDLTLADTVAVSGSEFSYLGVPGIVPNRTPGFDWKTEMPREGLTGTISIGLVFVGSLTMTLASIYSLNSRDYRRYAWAGLGATAVGFGLALPLGRKNRK